MDLEGWWGWKCQHPADNNEKLLSRSNERFKIERSCGNFASDVHFTVGYGKRERKNIGILSTFKRIQFKHQGFCFYLQRKINYSSAKVRTHVEKNTKFNYLPSHN